jgi:hypothetical protein
MMSERAKKEWYEHLSDEDLSFIKRFVLASGSLKEMAEVYGVSYPTVRRRLDRVIATVRVLDEQSVGSEFERVLRMCFAEGRLDQATVTLLLDAYRTESEG